jgi:hypothetical protein
VIDAPTLGQCAVEVKGRDNGTFGFTHLYSFTGS